jgi:hypothetical protein
MGKYLTSDPCSQWQRNIKAAVGHPHTDPLLVLAWVSPQENQPPKGAGRLRTVGIFRHGVLWLARLGDRKVPFQCLRI